MRRVPLIDELRRTRPDVSDPLEAIASGNVMVDGSIVTNPNSRVAIGCSIVVEHPFRLRGSAKLEAALELFPTEIAGRVCLDVGAAAGGFVTVLLERGAARVYAVDAGYGQLLGSLRQDPRVVNLERTNIAAAEIPEPIDVVIVDLSYLSLREAVTQLGRLDFKDGADLIGLVKPMFELGLSTAPTDGDSLDRAIGLATDGIESAGWSVRKTVHSPVPGGKGAIEGWVLAHREAN